MSLFYSEAGLGRKHKKAVEAGTTDLDYDFDRAIFAGPTNNEILGLPTGTVPDNITLQTIYELSRRTSGRAKICWFQPRRVISHTRILVHLDDRLPPPSVGAYDVYLVTQPDIIARASVLSPWHWSMYCNGHFYHLSLKTISSDEANTAERDLREPLMAKKERKRVVLKHEDLSSSETESFKKYQSIPGRVLSAYQVGQTEYEPDQIMKIATWVISLLQTYDLLHANCQHFAFGLLARILSRQRYEHVFVGSPLQVVSWDRGKRSGQPFGNGWGAGFLITYKSYRSTPFYPPRVIEQTRVQYASFNLAQLWPDSPEHFIFPNDILKYGTIRRGAIVLVYEFLGIGTAKWLLNKEDRTNSPDQWHYALLLPKGGGFPGVLGSSW